MDENRQGNNSASPVLSTSVPKLSLVCLKYDHTHKRMISMFTVDEAYIC